MEACRREMSADSSGHVAVQAVHALGVLAVVDAGERLRLDELNADEVVRARILTGPGEATHPPIGIDAYAAISLGRRIRYERHGHGGSQLGVPLRERAQVDVGDRVAVDDEERLALHEVQRMSRAPG